MLKILLSISSCFGICWIILSFLVLKFGGSIKVEVNSPITKKKDVLTNININK